MDCCSNNLGAFPHNEDLTFKDLLAPIDGEYTFELSGLGVIRAVKATFEAGDELVLSRFEVNEDFFYKMKIKQPDGTYFIGENDCENFDFQTYISTNSNCNSDDCTGDGDSIPPAYDSNGYS